jgi:hypothetical protein
MASFAARVKKCQISIGTPSIYANGALESNTPNIAAAVGTAESLDFNTVGA